VGVAAVVLVPTGACSSHQASGTPRVSRPMATASPHGCTLRGLSIKLTHGGLAAAGDFAVLEVRDARRQPCQVRSTIRLVALDEAGGRVHGVPVLRAEPAQPPIVLGPRPLGVTALRRRGDLDGLGILLTGGNDIGQGGCPRSRTIQPASWRIGVDRGREAIRNDLGKRNVAGRLSACRAKGQGFGSSRQMPNADLPISRRPG